MLNPENTLKVRRKKQNALVAIYLHKQQIHNLQQRNRFVDFLSIAVPASYFFPRFLSKGTTFAEFIGILGDSLAVILLILAILKIVYKWQDNEVKHAVMSRRNADTVYESERLLASKTASIEVVEQFLRRVQDIDDEDEALLTGTKEVDKQKAYRDALKRFGDNTVTPCPICGADPWKFMKGNCQACGGTPKP
jgi:mobilome CxxCx(11)CxxC protein